MGYCTKCGAENWEHARFCTKCGAKIVAPTVTAPPAVQQSASANPAGVDVEFKFHCVACGQPLKAALDMVGERVDCPACQTSIEIPRPQLSKESNTRGEVAGGSLPAPAMGDRREYFTQPPPAAVPPKPDGPCPLCGSARHMRKAKLLYGHWVCRKCHNEFATLRHVAYVIDSWLAPIYTLPFACAIAGIMIPLIALVFSMTNFRENSPLGQLCGQLLVLFIISLACSFKDCFKGYSIGKWFCGVRVMNETTGKPGSIMASAKRNLPLTVPFMSLIVAFQLHKGHRTGDGWSKTKVIWTKYAASPVFAIGRTNK